MYCCLAKLTDYLLPSASLSPEQAVIICTFRYFNTDVLTHLINMYAPSNLAWFSVGAWQQCCYAVSLQIAPPEVKIEVSSLKRSGLSV